jgi:hypothetical protein
MDNSEKANLAIFPRISEQSATATIVTLDWTISKGYYLGVDALERGWMSISVTLIGCGSGASYFATAFGWC